MQQSQKALVKRILKLSEDIYSALSPGIPAERLSIDITVAQLRVLLVLQTTRVCRMSDIASQLHITLPTATGILDNLVKKELVERENDPQDRRQVICRLSGTGQQLIDGLWLSGQTQMEKLLDELTIEQLEKAAEVAKILLDNLNKRVSDDGGGDIK